MTKQLCFMAVDKWLSIAEKRLGREVSEELVVSSVEFNKDYLGRLDGEIHCATRQDLKDTIERVYQKDDDLIRQELKLNSLMSVARLEKMFNSDGLNGVLGQQANNALEERLEGIERAMIYRAKNEEMSAENLKKIAPLEQHYGIVLEQLGTKSVDVEQLKKLALGQVEIFNLLVKKYTDLADLVTRFLTALGQKPPEQPNPEPSSDARPLPSTHFYE